MANELIATGVELHIGDAATTEVFTLTPGVVGIPSFPEADPAVIDVTALDSPGVEKILGLSDLGQFSFTLNMRKKTTGSGWLAQQQVVEGYAADGILRGFRLIVGKVVRLSFGDRAGVIQLAPPDLEGVG